MTDFRERPPGPEECERCGYAPAMRTTFRRQTGAVLAAWTRTDRATLCRSCATAAFRRDQNASLLLGWWGVWSFPTTFVVLVRNARQMRRVRALPEPWTRDPSVVTPLPMPADPGPPLVRRAGFWLVTTFLVAVLVANVAIALGVY